MDCKAFLIASMDEDVIPGESRRAVTAKDYSLF